MLFQTLHFAIFLVVVVTLLAATHRDDWRKIILLAASYFFYMWWKALYVLPLLATTSIDYFVGKTIETESREARRRLLLGLSIAANLGLLAFFKYYDFFAGNASAAARALGFDFAPPLLQLILPVGISFYTFHTMSYTIDVYRREIPACRRPCDFALFITFFPVLVAGPILRAKQVLPQLRRPIRLQFDAGIVLLFIRGLAKKVTVADNLSLFVGEVFENPARWPSIIIWLGAIAFAIQIYCDFSGYSDMARALARIFGLEIPLNFDRPYFARNPSEFWHRWHISLSSWLRDYLFIPLGGSRGGEWKTARNLLITMLLGGLWHGASWNFVLWGGLHAAFLIIFRIWRRFGPPLSAFVSWAALQYSVLLSWIAFRERDPRLILVAMRKFVQFDFDFALVHLGLAFFGLTAVIIAGFLLLHIAGERWGDLDQRIALLPLPAAGLICAAIGFVMLLFWPSAEQPFIYFQF